MTEHTSFFKVIQTEPQLIFNPLVHLRSFYNQL